MERTAEVSREGVTASTRRERIEDLFERAADLPAAEREELLARECVGDRALADEVRSLLASDDDGRGLRSTLAAAITALSADVPAGRLGARLGSYRLLDVIGEGGMGTVYLAERDDAEYRQRVAIKILRNGLGSSEALARFRDERQILAQLDHPGIVRLLDGGTTDVGLPYLVMEHVDGAPLTVHARGLPVRRRVELVRTLCGALQHAHQKLIVHRDIKPANILVDAGGVPKLLDFGIAKLLDGEAGREARTRTGMALLTPEYTSPEQARGERVTVAADIYSLGAVLYQLLVGAPPQRAQDSMLATLRVICEVEPPRPSAAAPASERRELAGDLDNIVMKALQKQPDARYDSVAALAEDLDRFLTGMPVNARASTLAYRVGKFVRRNRGSLAVTALVLGALATAVVISIVQARRAIQQTLIAEQQTEVAQRQTRSLLIEQALQEQAAGRASRALPYLAEVLRQGEDTAAVRFLLAEAIRPFEQQIGDGVTVKEGLVASIWSPDGSTIALAGWGGVMLLADRDLRVRTRLETIDDLVQHGASFSPDGAYLVAAVQPTDHERARYPDARVLVWDARTGALRHRWMPPDPREWTGINVGTRHVAAFSTNGAAVVWDLATGEEQIRIATEPAEVRGVVLAGDELVLGRVDGSLEWRDLASPSVVARRSSLGSGIAVLRTTPDGRVVASRDDGTVHIFDRPGVEPVAKLAVHDKAPNIGLYNSGSKLVTTVWGDPTIWLWDARTGHNLGTISERWSTLRSLDFSPDGNHVALAADHLFQVWSLRSFTRESLIESFAAAGDTPHSVGGAVHVSFSPDGTRLLTTSGTEATLWRISSAPLVRELKLPFSLWGARWSGDERKVAAVGLGAAIIDAETGARLADLDVDTARLLDAEWSHDGRRLVVTGYDGFAVVFSGDGRRERALVAHRGPVNGSVFSPDDRRLVTCGDDGAAIVWDPTTGQQETTLVHPARVLSATWTADGGHIVTAGWDRTLRIWDFARGEVVRELRGGKTQFLYASPSPDGTRVASAGHDGEVSVWDLATGSLTSLDGHTGPATQVEWSPDGELLATSADDGTARIWDPHTGRLLATRAHPGTNLQVWWSRDGRRLFTVNHHGTLRTWSVDLDRRPSAELLDVAHRVSPWTLVDGRLVRAR